MNKENKLFYNAFKDKSKVISNCWKQFINQEWINYYGFEAVAIPKYVWEQELILKKINEKFPFKQVGIIRLPSYYNYNWHRDTNRGCGLNMLLEHDKSHAFFQTRPHNYQGTKRFPNIDTVNNWFTELKYKPNTFYAFNTQKQHCVYNFDKPRYLFTVEFAEENRKISYKEICKWMKQNNLELKQ